MHSGLELTDVSAASGPRNSVTELMYRIPNDRGVIPDGVASSAEG